MCIQGASELLAIYLDNRTIAREPTESLRRVLVHAEDPLPTQRLWNAVFNIPYSECPGAYVGITGQEVAIHMKEHQILVRRQDESFFLVLHCPMALIGPWPQLLGMVQPKESKSSLRLGSQCQLIFTFAREYTCGTKPCDTIICAGARNLKRSVALSSFFPC